MKTISTVNVKKRMAELEISTQKELAEACGFSLSTARRVLGGLAKPEQSTVKLLAEGLKTTQGNILGEIQESTTPMDLSKEIYIPIRGKVWATPFRISMQRDYGVIRGLPGEQNCYALQVEGDSMLPAYVAGDYVVCRERRLALRPYAEDDDMPLYTPYEVMAPFHNRDVIVLHNGETNLKRIRIERRAGPKYSLHMISLNDKYPPVQLHFGDDWEMQAVVVRTQKPEIIE